jgi:hypothetical protein
VPAFVELAEQLEACGAPAELRARALTAADDELTHAVLAGQTAVALGAGPLTLAAPARGRRPAVAGADGTIRLAGESWLDGCLNEGAAAAVAAAESEVAEGALAGGLQRVAADEQRHADLAWDIVAWTVSTGGTSVRGALAQVSRAPSTPALCGADAGAGTGGLESWGCLGPAAAAQVGGAHAHAARQRLARLLAG